MTHKRSAGVYDIYNLLAYNVVMGLKNADLIKCLLEHIDMEVEEFTTVNIQEWILRNDSAKRNTATATKAKEAKSSKEKNKKTEEKQKKWRNNAHYVM